MNSLYSLTIVSTVLIAVLLAEETLEEDKNRIRDSVRFLQRLENTRQNVAALRDNIISLDGDLQHEQKRTCSVGLNSDSCKTMAVDDAMNALDWMSNGFSPGKRSAEKTRDLARTEAMLREIIRRRQSMRSLKSLLDQTENHILRESKRTCRMNLGGHCQTELASAIAEQWHYLNSPNSPGRKRRDTSLLEKLLAISPSTSA
ncbi:uncharacterized protein LOC135468965 [Liolophura sinensis]|uniref:uncharacterized protein LOC135468965 n=1 Tax=Liolophura sinensis TaxID=3198878 RepID=UPI0031591A06